MSQVMQIVYAVGAAIAIGTMVSVQASAADLPVRGAAIYQGDAIAQLKWLAKIGKARSKGPQSPMRDDVARNETAGGEEGPWFNPRPYFGPVPSGPKLEAGCAGAANRADRLSDQSDLACAYGLTAPWKIAGNFADRLGGDYDALTGAVAQSAGYWSKSRILPRTAAEMDSAFEVQARPAPWRSVFVSCASLLLAYLGYLAALTLLQRRFVFNPTHAEGPAAEPSDTHEVISASLGLAHNKAIRGWFLRPRQGKTPCPSIIYYGGRTEEVSWVRGAVKWFPEHAVLALNYRGYGESEGKPSEQGLFEDGLAQFDWLAAQPGVDPMGIVLVGRSLGTGVASYVAAKRPAARVVLITPYDSLLAVARRRFWFTPLSLLLRHKFRSVDYAKSNMQPCLALLAEHDDIVPEEHTHRLMAAWAGAKKLVRIPRTTHLDIPYQAATLTAVAIWLGYASVPSGPLALIARAS